MSRYDYRDPGQDPEYCDELGRLHPEEPQCERCRRPIAPNQPVDLCEWCLANDAHRKEAAADKPLRKGVA